MDDDRIWILATQEVKKIKKKHSIHPKKSVVKYRVSTNNEYREVQNRLYKIDLHSMTQSQALDFLTNQIKICYNNQIYNLLVITGKGSTNNPSVLKQELPRWLEHTDISELVLSHKFAQQKDGGTGARQVTLRKNI